MDPFRRDVGIGFADGRHDLGARGAVVDEDRVAGRLVHHPLRQDEIAHVALVGTGHLERLVEEVEHRHRPGRAALGKSRRVLQGVDGGAPDGDSGGLQVGPELGPLVGRVVDQAVDAAVEEPRDLGPRVDPAEAEQRVGAHLRRFSGLRHQTLTERDHHGVVFGQAAGEIPESLGQGVGRNGVGVLLDPVDAGLVEPCAFAPATEESGAEGGDRGGHHEGAFERAADERQVPAFRGVDELDLHVLQPQVETTEILPGCRKAHCAMRLRRSIFIRSTPCLTMPRL